MKISQYYLIYTPHKPYWIIRSSTDKKQLERILKRQYSDNFSYYKVVSSQDLRELNFDF